ncbi:MAG: alanine racemase [Clostridiales bacterium]|nr:alanine racemase [Clostridiales bacterium]
MDKYLEYLIKNNNNAFYLFDTAKLKDRVSYLRTHLPENARLCYAIKANQFIVNEIEPDVDRFECCSPGEVHICNNQGISSEKLVVSGVYKTPLAIEETIMEPSFKGIVTVESVRQYDQICSYSEKYSKRTKLLLRLTNNSQFGINASEIKSIIKASECKPFIDILGIQFFSGTQKTSEKKIRREIEMLDGFLTELKDELGFIAGELEYGPGFPVSYFTDNGFDEEAYLDSFCECINKMENKPELVIELGRSIAASCGRYYTHIVDIKNNGGQNYILVDGGMHHLVYFGQYMAMKQPYISLAGKEALERNTEWNICGSLCSMNDILAKNVLLPAQPEIGDMLCFENAGAYSVTEGISLFLCRDLPAVYILRDNKELYCVRKPYETYILNSSNYERMT